MYIYIYIFIYTSLSLSIYIYIFIYIYTQDKATYAKAKKAKKAKKAASGAASGAAQKPGAGTRAPGKKRTTAAQALKKRIYSQAYHTLRTSLLKRGASKELAKRKALTVRIRAENATHHGGGVTMHIYTSTKHC
jgi:hypothetical protein